MKPRYIFNVNILEQKDHEINIDGNRELVKKLRDSISAAGWILDYQEYTFSDRDISNHHASFAIGVWSLKKSIKGCSVAQIFLNFIQENQIQIDKRANYLLHYWAFEVKMIEEGNSYRSRMAKVCRQLTSADKINMILDRFKTTRFLPSPKHIFNLFENSDAMKGNFLYCQPLKPYYNEIEEFEKNQ